MITFFSTKTGLVILLLIVVALVAWGLFRRNRDQASAIDFDDLLLGDDGKMSKAAAVMLGAFLLTSWVIFNLTIRDRLTEGYFLAYLGAWVTPVVAKLITDARERKSEQP